MGRTARAGQRRLQPNKRRRKANSVEWKGEWGSPALAHEGDTGHPFIHTDVGLRGPPEGSQCLWRSWIAPLSRTSRSYPDKDASAEPVGDEGD